ncbi:MAG TPA: hypothetical protein VMI06_05165 [Terriglobia bacterium]|nr:hypothetical protein [Terriglobia bacterium]
MTDLVLEHLKRIQADMAEMKRDIRELKGTCSTTLGIVGELVKSEAREQARFSELEVRIERIERRLDIHDQP